MKPILVALITLSTSLWSQLPSYLNPNLNYGSVTDVDGNTYATIAIGTQVWMAENLRTSKYSNGSPIPNVTDGNQWGNMSSGACSSYNNNNTYDNPYGKFYNWYATVDPRNLCPIGWHVSSEYDWNVLTSFIQPSANTTNIGEICTTCAIKIRTQDNFYWASSDTVQYNSTGFSALSAGDRATSAGGPTSGTNYWFYNNRSNIGRFWTVDQNTLTDGWARIIQYFLSYSEIGRYNGDTKKRGYSVRCVNDFPNSIIENKNDRNINLKTYPNIAEDFINVEYSLNEKENIKISLLNIEGKTIKVFGNENQTVGFKRIFLDVTDIPSGIYMLKITGNKTNAYTKIIKQ